MVWPYDWEKKHEQDQRERNNEDFGDPHTVLKYIFFPASMITFESEHLGIFWIFCVYGGFLKSPARF
ncbi:MAG: hypothetical protein A2487_14795 [Candidatus Raymondbacteria bacterium RifOxyC12_full_50_8]|uniref:Uncharacterized protein n=1 Tax=Candidatus Raymondbacteria bacterium RIFOXYD12_FULL_49_13 TaxID=1817890 RepID=A0A1F7FHZ7_UNCRA|nr:MAG: hypothetical protein A2248_21325 [Candidatus Raymondbacteria bacterium RIFOXYA2_FULL_49_16]OGJ97426.1 MAG: hypothetical protein A2487_14795 [Candidatus Raymondbacteria bacterium RifOxyC12_full_50_8]OGJ98649.1 MAG: hypothetical protein A2350_13975 [Candidatus Raymondbacteria bacterium RifOxyB12_full_50_8]OGK06329.1 MAG: hypothetical protein A2519_08645 [Candidatus Raymondbacteria bacterium RIFOXYD12_FULL_49_13]OGP40663.1 MAG: hypothetical protein A2324_03395 [Candidatus Raymondbacteria b